MNIRSIFWIIIIISIPSVLFSQEKSSKELKEERKLERQKQTETLVNSKTFVFTGTMAYPQGGRSINLTTRPNFVKFNPDLIESDMPFFGRAYSGVGYGGSSDGGLAFKGAPSDFTVEKTKKGYQIRAVVSADNDSYTLSLSLSSEGSGSLSISSSRRSSMSYSGSISKTEGTE